MNLATRLLFVATLSAAPLCAQPVNWISRDHGLRGGSFFTDGVFGGGKFVLVASRLVSQTPVRYETEIASSADGVRWTVSRIPAEHFGYGIAYGNGLYVLACYPATGNSGTKNILTSPDGINWTARESGAGPLTAIASNGFYFVAIGPRTDGFNAVVSPDGITWRRMAIGREPEAISGIVARPNYGTFVAWTTQRSDLLWNASAVNGLTTWTQAPIFIPGRPQNSPPGWIAAVTAAGGKFVAIFQEITASSGRGRILSSATGVNWTSEGELTLPRTFLAAENRGLAVSADPASGRATLAFAGSLVNFSGNTFTTTPKMELSFGRFTSSVSYGFGEVAFDFVVYGDGQMVTGQYDSKIHTAAVTGGDYVAPVINASPASQISVVGGSATFEVSIIGSALTYQWAFNGNAIPGATNATYTIAPLALANAGRYQVTVTNPGGTVASNAATLTVNVAPPAIATQPVARTVDGGSSVTFASAASGSGLTYQWLFNNSAISGATDASYTIPSVTSADEGAYSVRITNAGGTITSNPATLTVIPPIAYLNNLSVRARAGSGSETLIVGVTIGGSPVSTAKSVLIRGIGPTLSTFGVTGVLADPVISILSGTTTITSNDDWDATSGIAATSTAVGAFALPVGSRDSALFGTGLGSGGYTVQLTGKAGATGNALVELYDTALAPSITATTTRFTNLSARTVGGTGADTLIVGFNVAGTSTRRLLLRAVGPGLAGFGVVGTMSDPKLELYSGQTKIGENDNWDSTATLAAQDSVGAFRLTAGSRDAVLVSNLSPGAYTVQVTGGTTGVVLVEAYEVP